MIIEVDCSFPDAVENSRVNASDPTTALKHDAQCINGAALALMDYPLALGSELHYNPRRKRTRRRFFMLHSSQRLRHVYLLGKGGMGANESMVSYALADIEQGLGCVFIDPRGADAEALLERIPPARRKDVIYFNPAEFPIAFNIFDDVAQEKIAYVASSMVDAVKTIWRLENAPNVDMFVYTATAALLEANGSTLLGLNYMLTSRTYRAQILKHIEDPIIVDFWRQTFDEHMTDRAQRDGTLSTINKLITLIADPVIRHCIAQQKSAFNFADIMQQRRIFIGCIPQGKTGIKKSATMISFLLASLQVRAVERPAKDRRLFPVYLTHAHYYMSETIAEMLNSLGDFGVSLTLSHQSLRQIEDGRLRARILGSIDTLVCFRLGPDDADELTRYFDNKKPDDLMRLWMRQALVRADEHTKELVTPELPLKSSAAGAAAIRRNCQHLHGRPIDEIKAEIARFVASVQPKKKTPKKKPEMPIETPAQGWRG